MSDYERIFIGMRDTATTRKTQKKRDDIKRGSSGGPSAPFEKIQRSGRRYIFCELAVFR